MALGFAPRAADRKPVRPAEAVFGLDDKVPFPTAAGLAFQHLTVSDAQLNAALREAILVKICDTDAVFRTLQQDAHYPELRGIGGQPLLPLFAIYSPEGVLVWKGQDYQAIQTMIAQLDQARRHTTP